MKAIILAGGKGRRLQPYSTILPKPLVPIGERPVLEIILYQLLHFGFKEVTLSCGYLSHLIQAYFNKSEVSGLLKIKYMHEDKPLGTAGSLSGLREKKKDVLVMNGDILTTLNYKALFGYHLKNKCDLTIACTYKKKKIDLGVVDVDRKGAIVNFREKPVEKFLVSMGIYVYGMRMFSLIRPGEHLDFPELVTRACAAGMKTAAYINNAYWLDIGSLDDYQQAQAEFEKMEGRLLHA